MDKQFNSTLYLIGDYLFVLGLKLIFVSKTSHGQHNLCETVKKSTNFKKWLMSKLLAITLIGDSLALLRPGHLQAWWWPYLCHIILKIRRTFNFQFRICTELEFESSTHFQYDMCSQWSKVIIEPLDWKSPDIYKVCIHICNIMYGYAKCTFNCISGDSTLISLSTKYPKYMLYQNVRRFVSCPCRLLIKWYFCDTHFIQMYL